MYGKSFACHKKRWMIKDNSNGRTQMRAPQYTWAQREGVYDRWNFFPIYFFQFRYFNAPTPEQIVIRE